MVFARECRQRVEESLLLEEGLKGEKRSLLNMVKLISLKKSDHFRKALKEKKVHTDFFSIFASKNFLEKYKNDLLISFVMKKKTGNAVKRNRIRRKLKAIVIKMLKIKGAINLNYTYIVFGKTKAYFAKHDELFEEMMKGFKKI